eukprot:GHVN01007384.1.p1 GENE.GHVN01007384.1~~GHVN01007384.1.p1  ORF type:complete len:117 (+),score=9.78 GHVN01007384.1:47-397(+)
MPLDLKAPQNDILAQMSHCLITSKISNEEWTLWSTTPFVEPFATVLGEAFTVDQSVGLFSDLVVLSCHHPLFGEDLLDKAVNKLSARFPPVKSTAGYQHLYPRRECVGLSTGILAS